MWIEYRDIQKFSTYNQIIVMARYEVKIFSTSFPLKFYNMIRMELVTLQNKTRKMYLYKLIKLIHQNLKIIEY